MVQLTRAEIEARIAALKPMSETARTILSVLEDPDHAMHDVVRAVECDAPLTVRVLRVANSAAFARATRAESLGQAISYIGERAVVACALSYGASELFDRPLDAYADGTMGLWESGLRAAVAGRIVASGAREDVSPSVAYTGALLRDIGKAVLSELLEGRAGSGVAPIVADACGDSSESERALTGWDHTRIGVMVAEHFDLSDALRDAIRFHHRPAKAPAPTAALVAAVHVADAIAGAAGARAPLLASSIDRSALERIGFPGERLEAACIATDEEFEQTRDALAAAG